MQFEFRDKIRERQYERVKRLMNMYDNKERQCAFIL